MSLDLVFNNPTLDNSFPERFFIKILETAIEELKIKDKVEMSINLVNGDKIKELNKKYRNKNKVTDVLSFPLEDKSLKNYGTILLGDIFICLSFAKEQAKRENISTKNKLARLTVHGFLHLLGYDHEISSKEAKRMFVLENKILKAVK